MTNMLTPEQRIDKNGKLVTRHVVAASSSASGSDIPAPSLTSSAVPEAMTEEQEREALIDESVDQLVECIQQHKLWNRDVEQLEECARSHLSGNVPLATVRAFARQVDQAVRSPNSKNDINNLANISTQKSKFDFVLTVECDDFVQVVNKCADYKVNTLDRVRQYFGTRNRSQYYSPYGNEQKVTDFKMDLYVEMLGFTDSDSGNAGVHAYYRSVDKLSKKIPEIEKTLPLFASVSKDYQFTIENLEDVGEIVSHAAQYSVDQLEVIKRYLLDNEIGYYDNDQIENVMEISSMSLADGAL